MWLTSGASGVASLRAADIPTPSAAAPLKARSDGLLDWTPIFALPSPRLTKRPRHRRRGLRVWRRRRGGKPGFATVGAGRSRNASPGFTVSSNAGVARSRPEGPQTTANYPSTAAKDTQVTLSSGWHRRRGCSVASTTCAWGSGCERAARAAGSGAPRSSTPKKMWRSET